MKVRLKYRERIGGIVYLPGAVLDLGDEEAKRLEGRFIQIDVPAPKVAAILRSEQVVTKTLEVIREHKAKRKRLMERRKKPVLVYDTSLQGGFAR